MGLSLKRSKTASTKPESPAWPNVNELVWVRLPCCETTIHPSRVENLFGERLAVAAPAKPHLSPVPPPKEGKTFMIGWRSGVSTKQVRVEYVAGEEEPVPTWILRPVSDIEMLQRRQFVRVACDQEIELQLPSLGGPTVGRLLDLSEGGLRCSVPSMPEPRNSYFQVEFEFEKTMKTFDVEVAWWGQPQTDDTCQIGLSFVGQDQASADKLRAYVFAKQLEDRQRD